MFAGTFFPQQVLSDSLHELAYMRKYDKVRYFLKTLILVNRTKVTQEDSSYIVLCSNYFSLSVPEVLKSGGVRLFRRTNKTAINGIRKTPIRKIGTNQTPPGESPPEKSPPRIIPLVLFNFFFFIVTVIIDTT